MNNNNNEIIFKQTFNSQQIFGNKPIIVSHNMPLESKV